MNRRGYTFLEVLLLIVIVVVIGGAGWFVWQSKDKADKSYVDADSANSSVVKYVSKDLAADWVAYSNKEGKFYLKHPKSWVEASSPELCNPGLFLVGANASSVGKCATESFGQMSILSVEGDNRQDAELGPDYTNVQTTEVTVDGVKGKKQTGNIEDGTSLTKYTFLTNGRTYSASYAKSTNYPDVLSDFETMVTKTLKFSS